MTYAVLLGLGADAPRARVEALETSLGLGGERTRFRAVGETPALGWLILGTGDAPVPDGGHEVFAAATEPVRADPSGQADPEVVFLVANNVLDGQDEAFDHWYDRVHVPHTFEYFDFRAAQRFVATAPEPTYARLIVYTSPPDVQGARDAMAWAAEDRARAVAEGREPALPVSDSLTGPRHAGFYERA